MLSIVDNRTFKRLVFEVLSKSPTKEDVEWFLAHFWGLLTRRGLSVVGVTTDGSTLYPEAIRKVFGPVPHQICEFHVLKEITHAVLRAVAKVRKQLAAQSPKLPRGRPSKGEGRRLARRKARQGARIRELFEHRHLFVRRDLTEGQRNTLRRITRGLPALGPLREIMEEVYRLFDRRCRMETALERLGRLRRRARRFPRLGRVLQKLFSPTLEKALTFLDDRLLPSTSNAVERGNRRHRKMQKSIYRVRKQKNLVGRMALDLLRDQRRASRATSLETLHAQRTNAQAPTAAHAARKIRGKRCPRPATAGAA